MTNRIGWELQSYEFSIKQGSAGSYDVTSVVLNADDSPLPSYDGWTAKLELFARNATIPGLTLTPSVVGDSGAHTLTVSLVFDEDATAELNPGIYRGDLVLKQPGSDALYIPCDVSLTVERTFTTL